MSFESWHSQITEELSQFLKSNIQHEDFHHVIDYSVIPAGKLFRPLLIMSLAQDLDTPSKDHIKFAQAIELHHAYTLIHDDLPAMDDDDFRRGREASHKKFNEWKAILAGDSLLNLSYELLTHIESDQALKLIKLFSQYMGPNGLILGQYLDLNNESQTINEILKIHELKTARLIQLSLLGSSMLSKNPMNTEDCLNLGLSLGVNFQLLDDLCELTEEVNVHEGEINPFLNLDVDELIGIIKTNDKAIKDILTKYELNTLREYIKKYTQKIQNILNSGRDKVQESLKLNNIQDFIENIGPN